MAISTNLSYKPYSGNGSTLTFEFKGRVGTAAELRVVRTIKATAVPTLWVDGVDYNATGFGTNSIIVTPTTILPSTEEIVIFPQPDLLQPQEYEELDLFPSQLMEDDSDKGALATQSQQREIDQSIKVPVSDLGTISTTLPNRIDRANKALTFDALGNPQASTLSGDDLANNALNVTFDPAGAGAAATTVEAKLREVVSVMDSDGVLGDGINDDTVGIQARIDYVEITGGILVFPPGTYAISSQLLCDSHNVMLLGVSRASNIIPHGSWSGTTAMRFSGVTNCEANNIFFSGFTTETALAFGVSQNCRDTNIITDLCNVGINLNSVNAHHSNGLVATNSTLIGMTIAGISSRSKNITVNGFDIDTTLGEHGIYAVEVDGLTLRDGSIKNTKEAVGAGIKLGESTVENSARDVTIDTVKISNAGSPGIVFAPFCKDVDIVNTLIEKSRNHAILVNGGAGDIRVRGGTFRNNGQGGGNISGIAVYLVSGAGGDVGSFSISGGTNIYDDQAIPTQTRAFGSFDVGAGPNRIQNIDISGHYDGAIAQASITAFADPGGGQVTVTSNGHSVVAGRSVIIAGTTSYNGTFAVANVLTNTFEITATFVADDATGTFLLNQTAPIRIPQNDQSYARNIGGFVMNNEDLTEITTVSGLASIPHGMAVTPDYGWQNLKGAAAGRDVELVSYDPTNINVRVVDAAGATVDATFDVVWSAARKSAI